MLRALTSNIRNSFQLRACYYSSMKGKVVVISGASSGIGEEVGIQYAKKGANVVLSARREEKLLAVAQKCKEYGSPLVEIVLCDVSKESNCKHLIAMTIEKFGAIDILVLNAGVGQTFFLEAMHPEVNIRQFMDINYYGCVYLTIAALPHLQKSGGSIVVVSSLGGLIPFPRQTLYNASKYALMGFFDSLRMELQAKQSKVSITMICPGFIKTEITAGGGIGKDGKAVGPSKPLPVPMITAEECAKNILHATETRKRLVITPVWYTPVYLMRRFFPSLTDKLLIRMFAPPPKKK